MNEKVYISEDAFEGFRLTSLTKENQRLAIRKNSELVNLYAFCILLRTLSGNGVIMVKSDRELFRRLSGKIGDYTFRKCLAACKRNGMIKLVSTKNGILHYLVRSTVKIEGRRARRKYPIVFGKRYDFKVIRDKIYEAATLMFFHRISRNAKVMVNAFVHLTKVGPEKAMAAIEETYGRKIAQELSHAYKCYRLICCGDPKETMKVLMPILNRRFFTISMKRMRVLMGMSKNRLNDCKKVLIKKRLIDREYQYEELTEEEYEATLEQIHQGKAKVHVTRRIVSEFGRPRCICCKMLPNSYELRGYVSLVGKWSFDGYSRQRQRADVKLVGLKVGSYRKNICKEISGWYCDFSFAAC